MDNNIGQLPTRSINEEASTVLDHAANFEQPQPNQIDIMLESLKEKLLERRSVYEAAKRKAEYSAHRLEDAQKCKKYAQSYYDTTTRALNVLLADKTTTELAGGSNHSSLQKSRQQFADDVKRRCQEAQVELTSAIKLHDKCVFADKLDILAYRFASSELQMVEKHYRILGRLKEHPEDGPIAEPETTRIDGQREEGWNGRLIPNGPGYKPFWQRGKGERVYFGSAVVGKGISPCRIYSNGSCFVLLNGLDILYDGNYFILMYDSKSCEFEWVNSELGDIPLGRTPVKGGYEESGEAWYHATVNVDSGYLPAKTNKTIVSGPWYWSDSSDTNQREELYTVTMVKKLL